MKLRRLLLLDSLCTCAKEAAARELTKTAEQLKTALLARKNGKLIRRTR